MALVVVSKLFLPAGVGSWTLARIPKEAAAKAGFRARLRVKGTIDTVPFSCSLLALGGELHVVVNSELRAQIGKRAGDTVELALRVDSTPVRIVVPPSLRRALGSSPAAKKAFDALAPSHRKAFAQWVAGAKLQGTTARRVARTLEMLRAGQTLT